ncbi:MAG TPA: O-acetylhomoserine aminocarboxypropyltransferase [Acidimicrobiia bacterium]|nr:O-acetylhomoserine aminocarboxypropyltransferase [Acidimicrobiia bacterium]
MSEEIRPDRLGFETLALHAGVEPDPRTGASNVPIYLSSSFVFEDADHAASLFNLEIPGHIYSRISNPTVAAFEERMAALEGGVGAVATASGQAALVLVATTLCESGSHIVASKSLYGGTINFLAHTLPRFGITTTFVDPARPEAVEEAVTDATRFVLAETVGNPTMRVADLPALAEVSHRHGLPLVVDNTFPTPYLCRPVEWGADIVFHSATKHISGHGSVIGGVVVDGGGFDWQASGRFPSLTEPYAPYGGIVFTDQFGTAAFAARARAEGIRDFGACMSPEVAYRLLEGLETLPARMDRHVANAVRVARYLASAEGVASVSYPGLDSHPDHDLAARLLPQGAGSIMSFVLTGGRDAGRRCIESLRLFSHLANVGDSRSLVIHPASTTHAQLGPQAMAAAGIDAGLVRLSVGLEDPDDLIADLARGLRAATR